MRGWVCLVRIRDNWMVTANQYVAVKPHAGKKNSECF